VSRVWQHLCVITVSRTPCRGCALCDGGDRLCVENSVRTRDTEIEVAVRTRSACAASGCGRQRRIGRTVYTRNGPGRWGRISSCGTPNCCWGEAPRAKMTTLPSLKSTKQFQSTNDAKVSAGGRKHHLFHQVTRKFRKMMKPSRVNIVFFLSIFL
jgi:hypothetical protein